MVYHSDKIKSDVIAHGFYTRQGGVSEGLYESLNCGSGSGDHGPLVQENRKRVRENLGATHLLSLYQIHSDTCLVIEKPWADEDRPQGDGFVTDQPGVALGILTADCAPVLFAGEKADGAPVIGAAHAGWKGALGGIVQATLTAMTDLGAQEESIVAAIGPCISKKSYEVDEGFFEAFINKDDTYEGFFGAAQRAGHHMFDLEGFLASQLAQVGVENIDMLGLDTYALEDEFFSYRRKTHRDEPDYGRQISAIMIR